MSGITFQGDKKLKAKLEKCKNPEAIKTIVQKNGDELNREMKSNTKSAFRKGYATGQTGSSINTVMKDSGYTAEVGPTTDYASYVEYGTRYMSKEPFVKPAYTAQAAKFKADLDKVVK